MENIKIALIALTPKGRSDRGRNAPKKAKTKIDKDKIVILYQI